MSTTNTFSEVDQDLMKEFLSGCEEHIAGAEGALISLEKDPTSTDLINDIFRHFHSIKGDAASMDIIAMRNLAHEMESLLDEMRTGVRSVSAELLDLLFEGVGLLSGQLRDVESENIPVEASDFLGRLSQAYQAPHEEVKQQAAVINTAVDLTITQQVVNNEDSEIRTEKTYILFRTGNLRCAINVVDSNEIISKPHITPVPNVEEFIEGVINLRGSIVPVINLSRRLKISGDQNESQQILILIFEGTRLGLLVDEVLGVETWMDARLLRPSSVAFALETTLVRDVVVENNHIHLILNLLEIIKRQRAQMVRA